MPELPEVETVRRGLVPVMEGHKFSRVDVRREGLRWPFPEKMADRLAGQQVLGLRRRSKYILIDLGSNESLIIHLGMSGRMLINRLAAGQHFHDLPLPEKHDHVVFDMDSGARIAFNDARRFGAMDLWATGDLENHRFLASLGPEPLGNNFDSEYLASRFKGRKMPVKSALLDQKIVAGLGNIYVCEALWRAKISPLKPAQDVKPKQMEPLVRVIRDVLAEAIESGGSSLKDYRQTDGELGYFQHSFAAYGREGEPCRTHDCKGEIARIVQSGRSSFFCNKCQR